MANGAVGCMLAASTCSRTRRKERAWLARSITTLAGATALVVGVLAAAGCGGSGGSNANSPAPPQNANGQSATVGVANENVGKILVDSHGRTLYLFERDSGTKLSPTGACAVEWPPRGRPPSRRSAVE